MPGAYINDIATDDRPDRQAIFNLLKELNTCGATGLATAMSMACTTISAFDIYPSVTGGGGPACAISHAEAIAMFAAYNLKADLCFFAKVNCPSRA